MKISVIIPTWKAGKDIEELILRLHNQTIKPEQIIIIDSCSLDGTAEIALSANCIVKVIKKSMFNHGRTRNIGRTLCKSDIYVYFTQDAIPYNRFVLEKLVQPFIEYPQVGLTYGRQLPVPGAMPIEAFSRIFNYPAVSKLKKINETRYLGIKTVFCSNSFAAYRREALDAVGGFPENVILCEDIYVGAKMLLEGYDIFYAADALVYHSHNYSILQEFRRYFDLGVFYGSQEKWIVDLFGNTGKEGARFFFEGWRYLRKNKYRYVYIEWIIRNIAKMVGYKLGNKERHIPMVFKHYLSMHRKHWE